MRKIFAIVMVMFFSSVASASEPEILNQFFGQQGIPNKRAMYRGEMLKYFADKPTIGEGLQKDVKAEFRKLSESSSAAVYAVLLSKNNQTQDWYVFLLKENGAWKMNAVRRLALTGLPFTVMKGLELKNSRTAEEEWEYQNLRLTVGSDSELRRHLIDHVGEFDEIASLFMRENTVAAKELAKKLFVSSVVIEGGFMHLYLGGILDNSVGYLYVPVGKTPPKMSPDGYIYIEKISGCWYAYKTT